MNRIDPKPIKYDFGPYHRRANLYDQEAISKVRAEKGLPDPFSNMSFAGTDISATMVIPVIDRLNGTIQSMDVLELAEVQTISYSIHRENSPVRTVGHVNPRGFVKGGRTIAGSLIFTVFNEYAFYRIKEYRNIMSETGLFFAPLADMLPPFDIVLTFFNEYENNNIDNNENLINYNKRKIQNVLEKNFNLFLTHLILIIYIFNVLHLYF